MKQQAGAVLLILAITTQLQAQEQLSDRWKEIHRTDLKKKAVSFTDTLRLSEIGKESMMLRKGAFQYKGQINNDVLDLGYTNLHIIKNNKDEVQLGDEDYIHFFIRETKDMSASDALTKQAGIDLPAEPVKQIDLPTLSGTWNAYKRTGKNGPLPKIDYKTLISSISVFQQNPEGHIGSVSAGGSEPLYFIKECRESRIIAIDKEKAEHPLTVWRLTADELVIEDGQGIIYYMKHFR